MVVIAPPNPESRRIAELQTDLELRLKRVEAGLRAAQLGNASMQGTGIGLYDGDGNYRGSVGIQPDGSAAVVSTPPVPPPVPSAPQVLPAFGPTLIIKAVGETADGTGWPADWLNNPLYKVYYADAINPTVWTLGGTITGQSAETVVGPLEYTQYNFALTAVGPTGLESEKSQISTGTPTQVVSADIINGIIQEVHLNSNIVGEAALKANAVTATKIADGSIETPKIAAGAVLAGKIAADQINAGHLTAGSVTTEKIQALAITGDKISANTIEAGHLKAGIITAAKLEANMVISTRIIAGTSTGARVEMHPTSGLQAYQSNGTTRTFWLDAATGSAFMMGTISTAPSGTRIEINPGGNNPDTIRLFPGSGTSGYASIDAFSATSTLAGIQVQGSGTTGTARRGMLLVRDIYSSLLHGASDRSFFGPEVYVDNFRAATKGALVDLIVDQRLTPDSLGYRAAFVHYNSSNAPRSITEIFYQLDGASHPGFLSNFNGAGLKFSDGIVCITKNDLDVWGEVRAATHSTAPSSIETKEGVAEITSLPEERSTWDVIEGAPALDWRYVFERPDPREDEGPINPRTGKRLTKWVRKPNLSDEEFERLTKNAHPEDVGLAHDEVPMTWADVPGGRPVTQKLHRFPIAEDLAALDPSLAALADNPMNTSVDLRDMIGILWDAVDKLIKRTRIYEDLIGQRFNLTLPPRPQKGDMLEGIGKVKPGRTRRDIDPVTRQAKGKRYGVATA